MVGPFYEVKMLEIVTKITASDADRPFIPTMLLFKRKQARSSEEEGINKCRSVPLPVDNRPDSALSMLVLTPRTSIFSHADSYDSQRGLTHRCTGLLLAFANARPMELHYCRLLPRLISSSGYCSNTPHLEQNFGYLATPILLVTTCYAYKNSLAFWQTFDR